MAEQLEIENQGRHDGEGFRELAGDLWSNKPLLFVFLAGIFIVVYLIARNKSNLIAAPGSTTNAATDSSNGSYLIVNDNQPPPVNVTVNSPPTSGGSGSKPPVQPIGPIIGSNPITTSGGSGSSGGSKARTVVVKPWPSQDSTIWGIAQHYGVNEQALYSLNKSKIGSNPNLIHAGMVLTLPS